MEIARQVTRLKMAIYRGLATQHPLKLVGILALGVVFLTASGLHFAPGDTGGEDTPALRSSVPGLEVISEHTWIVDSPYYDDSRATELGRSTTFSGAQTYPEDQWLYNAPYYDEFLSDE